MFGCSDGIVRRSLLVTSQPSTLLLVPTELELDLLRDITGKFRNVLTAKICGFGPIAAAARTSQLLSQIQPNRAFLIGIAGTYDECRLPVTSASTFDEVILDGMGSGQGASYRNASKMGFAQWPGSEDTCHEPIYQRLHLVPVPVSNQSSNQNRVLLTTCSASASPSEAEARRNNYQDAIAEDMEAFSVAIACAFHQVPLGVIRGISNVAGDRRRAQWQIEPALREAARLLTIALDEQSSEAEPVNQ